MTNRDPNAWAPERPRFWLIWFPLLVGGVLGIAGFLSGFLGPMVLNPSANQGPMLGIFITGPFSCFGGALIGLLIGWLWPNRKRALTVFFAILAAQVLTILFFCLPGDKPLGYVVELEVISCEAPDGLIPAKVEVWQAKATNITWTTPRAGWEAEALTLPQTDPGVILTVKRKKRWRIKEGRKPWNKGKLWARALDEKTAPKEYILQNAVCGDPGTSGGGTYNLVWSTSRNTWPPDTLAGFLEMRTLQPLPSAWEPLIREAK